MHHADSSITGGAMSVSDTPNCSVLRNTKCSLCHAGDGTTASATSSPLTFRTVGRK